MPSGVLQTGPGIPSATSTSDSVSLAYSSPLGSGLALTPSADCRTTAKIPAPANASAAVCCQTAAAGTEAAWPFELRLNDNATWVLAVATVSAGSNVNLKPLNTSAAADGPYTAVRYAWQGYPLCVLANSQGLPGVPFLLEDVAVI